MASESSEKLPEYVWSWNYRKC